MDKERKKAGRIERTSKRWKEEGSHKEIRQNRKKEREKQTRNKKKQRMQEMKKKLKLKQGRQKTKNRGKKINLNIQWGDKKNTDLAF